MGLLDEVLQMAGKGTNSEGDQSSMASTIFEMLQSGQGGGLSGLVNSFQSKGMGDIVSSWIGTGQNAPISAGQVQSALGSDFIQQLASRAGVSHINAGSLLAGLLPVIIDKLTPDGNLPTDSGSGLLGAAMNMLKGKL